MKKALKYIFSISVMCIMLLLSMEHIYADNIGISAGKSTVNIGDKVTITVSVPEDVSGTMNILYPADLLEFQNASAEVNATKAGTLAVSIGKYGLVASNKLTITFKAKTTGEATVKASGINFFDNSGESEEISLGDSATKITIQNETTNTELSADNYLAKLSLTAGSKKLTLSPKFSYKKLNYTAEVGNEVTDVVVSVTRSSGKAEIVSVTDNGKVKLEVGDNKIEIVVKAENGKTRTYTVTVTRKEKEENTQPPESTDPTPTEQDFMHGDTALYTAKAPSDKVPANFTQKTVILAGGKEVTGFAFEKADVTLLYLENDSKAGSFYVYDAADHAIYPFVKIAAEETYVIVLTPDEENLINGYTACTLSIEGKGAVSAYRSITENTALSEFYLLYCVNSNGAKGWYCYDTVEGTFQRYIGTIGTVQNPQETESESESESKSEMTESGSSNEPVSGGTEKPFQIGKYKWVILSAIVFLAAVAAIIIIRIVFFKKRGKETEEEDDEVEFLDI